MKPEAHRILALHDEVGTSVALIRRGLRELKNISGANDFYFLPFFLLATGFERLGKCIYCLHVLEKTGSFPGSARDFPAGNNGHDVEELTGWITTTLFDTDYLARPAAREDLAFLREDEVVSRVIHVLSEFGQSARYYNLDVVLGRDRGLRNSEEIWQALEMDLLKREGGWATLLASGSLDRVYVIINDGLVVPIERLARALCRLFTLGPLGAEGKCVMPLLTPFLKLRDDDFGKLTYE